MKKSIAAAFAASLLLAMTGCVFVHDRKPEAVSTTTTRETTVGVVPADTTVQRTTVY